MRSRQKCFITKDEIYRSDPLSRLRGCGCCLSASRSCWEKSGEASLQIGEEEMERGAANNTSNTVQVVGIRPNSADEIVLTIHKSSNNDNFSGFFYMGAREIAVSGVIETSDFNSEADVDGDDFLT